MTTKPGLLTISLMGLLLCGPACFDGGKDSNDTGGETEGDADADADGDTDTDGQSPWIEAGDAYCYQHKTGVIEQAGYGVDSLGIVCRGVERPLVELVAGLVLVAPGIGLEDRGGVARGAPGRACSGAGTAG